MFQRRNPRSPDEYDGNLQTWGNILHDFINGLDDSDYSEMLSLQSRFIQSQLEFRAKVEELLPTEYELKRAFFESVKQQKLSELENELTCLKGNIEQLGFQIAYNENQLNTLSRSLASLDGNAIEEIERNAVTAYLRERKTAFKARIKTLRDNWESEISSGDRWIVIKAALCLNFTDSGTGKFHHLDDIVNGDFETKLEHYMKLIFDAKQYRSIYSCILRELSGIDYRISLDSKFVKLDFSKEDVVLIQQNLEEFERGFRAIFSDFLSNPGINLENFIEERKRVELDRLERDRVRQLTELPIEILRKKDLFETHQQSILNIEAEKKRLEQSEFSESEVPDGFVNYQKSKIKEFKDQNGLPVHIDSFLQEFSALDLNRL